ncbi:hypothetical protein ONE63_006468 [Megalurothrips usitatus]|uniref:Uncharacterized protein n=1 Tax=Megalurothrips usitatus TaxID=439358 RepID=A0AAV7XTG3_9NEOP|nr:hypothetical protein ONE63_006468 [Megalurothrips usitatus]
MQFDTTPGAPDWSWYDGLAALDSGIADVLVGQYMYMDYRYDKYASLGPHGVSYYRWYMPRPAPSFLPILPHIMLPVEVVVFVFVVLAGLCFVAALSAVLLDTSVWSGVLSVWSLSMDQPVAMSSVHAMSLPARVVLLTTLVGFLNVNVVVKSVIVSSMSRPQIVEALTCPADLLELDSVAVGTESPIINHIMGLSDDPAVRRLLNQTRECYLNFTECTEYLQSSANADEFFCMVASEEMISFASPIASKFTLYTFDMPLQRNIYGWYARKMFPLKDRANLLFLLLQQSGLQANWARTLSVNMSAVVSWLGAPHPCLDGNACPINFERARNLFVLLGLGLLASSLVFVLERAARRLPVRHGLSRPPKRRIRRRAARPRKSTAWR